MANKTYLIEFESGKRQKITVPEDWKVTFGPAVVGNSNPHKKMPMALRFYESKEKQRGIFLNVVSFRDVSIKIEEERIRKQDKVGTINVEGAQKTVVMQAKMREWVDPDTDEINQDAKKLLKNTKIDDFDILRESDDWDDEDEWDD